MRKTIYKIDMFGKETYWCGDKILRIAFVITNLIEMSCIIYLLIR
jgi:hypothetical protein